MADAQNENDEDCTMHLIDNPIVANAHPIGILFSDDFANTRRKRVIRECIDLGFDAMADALVHLGQSLGSGFSKTNGVAHEGIGLRSQ
jgi:hypothetical protein